MIAQVAVRLRGVVVDHLPALEAIERYDQQDALFYVDPPYPLEARGRWASSGYRWELKQQDHRELAEVLQRVRGAAVVSGYRCELYDSLYGNWQRVEKVTLADGARRRTEVLWLSPRVELEPDLFTGRGEL